MAISYTVESTARAHAALAEVSRLRLLEILRAHGEEGMDAAAAASAIGLHIATTRTHLETLVEAGLAERAPAPRSTRGRPRIVYRARPAEEGSRGDAYRLLAEILATMVERQNPAPKAVAESAGKAWGRALVRRARPLATLPREEALQRLEELLDELGFEPERAGGDRIDLHRCPFLDVASEHRSVVCAAHLGIIKGALEEVGAPMGRTTLQPLVTPTLCVARLAK